MTYRLRYAQQKAPKQNYSTERPNMPNYSARYADSGIQLPTRSFDQTALKHARDRENPFSARRETYSQASRVSIDPRYRTRPPEPEVVPPTSPYEAAGRYTQDHGNPFAVGPGAYLQVPQEPATPRSRQREVPPTRPDNQAASGYAPSYYEHPSSRRPRADPQESIYPRYSTRSQEPEAPSTKSDQDAIDHALRHKKKSARGPQAPRDFVDQSHTTTTTTTRESHRPSRAAPQQSTSAQSSKHSSDRKRRPEKNRGRGEQPSPPLPEWDEGLGEQQFHPPPQRDGFPPLPPPPMGANHVAKEVPMKLLEGKGPDEIISEIVSGVGKLKAGGFAK